MNDIYAIEPDGSHLDENDLLYIRDNFGFSEGRFVALFPKAWQKRVWDTIGDLSEMQRARFTFRLQGITERHCFCKTGFKFNPNMEWVDNASRLREQVIEVIAGEGNRHGFRSMTEVREQGLNDSRSKLVFATAVDYARVANNLLSSSNEVTLVDPYFDPLLKEGRRAVLEEFLKIGSGRPFILNIYSSFQKVEPINRFQDLYNKNIRPLLGDSQQIVLRVVNDLGWHQMHARYLLSDKGGITFDRGFATNTERVKVLVAALTKNVWEELYEVYVANMSSHEVIAEYR